MNSLIGGDFGIFFDVKDGDGSGISIYCVNLQGGKSELIGRSADRGFNSCLLLIESHRKSSYGLSASVRIYEWSLLVRHIALYRENLYGLFCCENEVGGEWVAFFKEAYVFYFALELSSVFFDLSAGELASLESFLQAGDSGHDGDMSELRDYYAKWKSISVRG
ncbi:hypothetical protein ACI2IY_18680 [Lysobacter enzymogenes]|uniref:hypothetical protein n=1 Tax=Lysobacter enzymogenes TaxID=69 RepID=UPI00384F3F31